MKKSVQSLIGRIASCFLCALSVLMVVAVVLGSVFFSQVGDMKDAVNDGKKSIAVKQIRQARKFPESTLDIIYGGITEPSCVQYQLYRCPFHFFKRSICFSVFKSLE